jgi:hypothetical protein
VRLFLIIVLSIVCGATVGQFLRLARPVFRFAFWLAVLALVLSLPGCATPPSVGIWECRPAQTCSIDTENGEIVLRPCK